MIYRNLNDLMERVADIDSLSNVERDSLRALLRVYWDAYYHPPTGVVGVGIVSYAESALVAYQLKGATK